MHAAQVHLFEFDITEWQYRRGTLWMEYFRNHVPDYRIIGNETCTEEAEDMFNGWLAFNLGIPDGSSPVQVSFNNPITGSPVTLNDDAINPHGLYTQLVAEGYTDNLRNTSLIVDSSFHILTGVRDPLLPPNTVPAVTDDVFNEENIDNAAIIFDVLANDSDVDGEPINISHLTSIPASVGTVVVTPGNQVEFTPTANYTGTFTFNYTVSDPHGGNSIGTVNVTVTNPPPSAIDDNISVVNVGTTISLNVLGNDSDPHGDSLTLSAVSSIPTSAGSVSIVGNSLRYTPVSGYTGSAGFEYTIRDPFGNSSTARIDLNITNPAPTAAADSYSIRNTNSPISLNVISNDTDPHGEALTVSNVTSILPSEGTLTMSAGNIIYTPTSGYSGVVSFDYTVTDTYGGSSASTVRLNVTN